MGLTALVGDRDVQLLDGRARGGLAAAVIPLGRRHVGVSSELRHRRDIDLGFPQIGHDDVDTCQDHRFAYSSPSVRRSHSRALRLADSRLWAM